MKELKIENKQKYLNEQYPFADPPKLTDIKECIHCGEVITVGNFKVFQNKQGNEYIFCPNAPDCDGTVIDWVPVKSKI